MAKAVCLDLHIQITNKFPLTYTVNNAIMLAWGQSSIKIIPRPSQKETKTKSKCNEKWNQNEIITKNNRAKGHPSELGELLQIVFGLGGDLHCILLGSQMGAISKAGQIRYRYRGGRQTFVLDSRNGECIYIYIYIYMVLSNILQYTWKSNKTGKNYTKPVIVSHCFRINWLLQIFTLRNTQSNLQQVHFYSGRSSACN